uniref:Uncharacterized protein n=1 Tax=Lactuca sativa TaxID=4236 RepID=A0A9R1V6I0_LACSA|nr:hypothetical protein LSAT_V11C600329440 [Lactuca sativa]
MLPEDPTKNHAQSPKIRSLLSIHMGMHNLKISTSDELWRAIRNFRPSAMVGVSDGDHGAPAEYAILEHSVVIHYIKLYISLNHETVIGLIILMIL